MQRLQYVTILAPIAVILSAINFFPHTPSEITYRKASPNPNDCCRALAGH
jgi:hypothetical protein